MKKFAISMMLLLLAVSPAMADKSVEGSSVNFVSYEHDSQILTLEICNGSVDAEWHVSSTITLPSCLTFQDASYDDGGLGYLYAFSGIGSSTLVMTDDDEGYGELHGGECLTLTLRLGNGCVDPTQLCMDWDFVGDVYGGEPHTVSGSICDDNTPVSNVDFSMDSLKSMYR